MAGTTTTSVLIDTHDGTLLADPILYNESQGQQVVSAAEVNRAEANYIALLYCSDDWAGQSDLLCCGDSNTLLLLQAIAPADHSATASVSSLCKLLFWHQQGVWQKVLSVLWLSYFVLMGADSFCIASYCSESCWHCSLCSA